MDKQIIKILFLLALIIPNSYFVFGKDFVDYYKKPAVEDFIIHNTKYDYSEFAEQVTKGSHSNFEKIRAIYQWICRNIDYDTSSCIYSADECIEQKRGVCQAYCELFYHLAKAVGVRVEIIDGKSKNKDGIVSNSSHAWLFAYTRPNHGILLDPTWGAGTVNNHKFTRRKNCWIWFNVDPEWMILSHYPEDKSYQLIDKQLSFSEFRSLPPANEVWLEYGLNTHLIFEKAIKHTLSLPVFYSGGEDEFEILDIPQTKSLKIGEFYTFRIKMKSSRVFCVTNEDVRYEKKEWKNEGKGVYSISFMPRREGNLIISLKDKNRESYWNYMLEYAIEKPNQVNWSKVEKYYPLCIPEVKNVKNLDAEKWKAVGIDERHLLEFIRNQNIKELPIIYNSRGQKLKVVSIPMNKQLRVGNTYVFCFYPQSGISWAVVNNDKWFREWLISEKGMYSVTITPQEPGDLSLYVQISQDKPYYQSLQYDVIK